MFLFIHYKPESYDEDGAYHEGKFMIVNWLTADELIDVWAERLCRNINREPGEAEIECYVFKDGVQVWADGSFSWDGRDRPAAAALSERELDNEETADEAEMTILFKHATSRAAVLAAKEKADLQRANAAAIADHERANQEARRRQFLALKAEFEPQQ